LLNLSRLDTAGERSGKAKKAGCDKRAPFPESWATFNTVVGRKVKPGLAVLPGIWAREGGPGQIESLPIKAPFDVVHLSKTSI
jgi:hypothetical protein